MSSASDISNLFQTLGVSPSHYQEVEKTEQMQGSRGRWSMQAGPSPADAAQPDAPGEAEAGAGTDASGMTPAAQSQPVASAVPAAGSGSVPAAQAAAEQSVLESNREPVAAPERPDAPGAASARRREGSGPKDLAQRQMS